MPNSKQKKSSEGSSRWGRNDEIGALNEITPSTIIQAARLVKTGKVYPLAHVLEPGIPQHWFHGEFQYATFRRHSDTLNLFNSKNRVSAMNMELSMADHTGTHIDGLSHISIDGKLYNDNDAQSITGTFGTSKLGIEKSPPIFTRGVFLDVAGLRDKDVFEPNYVVTSNDIKECLEKNNLEIQSGNAVLIRTGWSKHWMKDNEKYLGPVRE